MKTDGIDLFMAFMARLLYLFICDQLKVLVVN